VAGPAIAIAAAANNTHEARRITPSRRRDIPRDGSVMEEGCGRKRKHRKAARIITWEALVRSHDICGRDRPHRAAGMRNAALARRRPSSSAVVMTTLKRFLRRRALVFIMLGIAELRVPAGHTT
jgi:hypothetical protein